MIPINMSMLFAGNMLPFVEKISPKGGYLVNIAQRFPEREKKTVLE